MKKYNAKVNWFNIIEILIGRLILCCVGAFLIIACIGAINWFIQVYLAQHTIARVIFYIAATVTVIFLLHKEFKE